MRPRQARREGGRKPLDQCIEIRVPAIVTEDIWLAAQKQRGNNMVKAVRNTKHDYLMQYLLTCGECGHSTRVSARSDAHDKLYFYYRCRSDAGHYVHNCNSPNFRADHLDALVWHWLKGWFQDPANLRRKLEAYRAERDQANTPIWHYSMQTRTCCLLTKPN